MSDLVLIRAMPDGERREWAMDLASELGDPVIIVTDTKRSAYETWLSALEFQALTGRGAWHLEDDVILTRSWRAKAGVLVLEHPVDIIVGFSRHLDDRRLGSRWLDGQDFAYSQCVHVPGHLAGPLLEHNRNSPLRNHPAQPSDSALREYMCWKHLRYFNVVPSLVEHRVTPSAIDDRVQDRRAAVFVP